MAPLSSLERGGAFPLPPPGSSSDDDQIEEKWDAGVAGTGKHQHKRIARDPQYPKSRNCSLMDRIIMKVVILDDIAIFLAISSKMTTT